MMRSRRWYLLLGSLLIGLVFLVAVFADQITPVSPYYWDAHTSVLDGTPPFPPGPGHPLGTDLFGRDVWSRVAYGTRWSLLFGLLIMGARLALALPAALIGVYGPRRFGWLVDKCYVLTTSIPPLLIYLLLLSPPQLRLIGLWPSVVLTITVLTVMEWPRLAVTLKGRLEQLVAEPFVEGAVAAGGTRWHIFVTHLTPHLWPTFLHVMAAEMARALLLIAQLGVFGLMVGGGVLTPVDNGRGGDKWLITTGVPEWGNMLAEGRTYLLTKPWIPFAPAVAFLVAVVGFNLLSQGLEGSSLSIKRLTERTTGRLSRRWRWALALVPVILTLWFYQGLPWTREAGILALAEQQAALLTQGDVEGYLNTTAPGTPAGMADFQRWAENQITAGLHTVNITPRQVHMTGSHATATWDVEVAYRTAAPQTFTRQTHLVRRLGRWYEAGEPYAVIRGYFVDVEAVFDPVDPTQQAVVPRWNMQFLATSADHAYQRVSQASGLTGQTARPRIRIYPTHEAFVKATGATPNGSSLYIPGEAIRLSPTYLKGYRRWDVEKNLAYELVKSLHGGAQISPLVMGRYELASGETAPYRVDFSRMTDGPFFTFDELLSIPMQELSQSRQWLYVIEAALLTEFMGDRPPEGAITPRVAAEFDQYLYERVAGESIMTVPTARARVPDRVITALEERARKETSQPEVAAFAYTLLDWDEKSQQAYVLERRNLTDGQTVIRVERAPL